MSDDEDVPDNLIVVAFGGGDVPPRYPIQRDSGSPTKCWHPRALVNRYDRTVRCSACGVDLDPIEVLDKIARDPAWIAQAHADRKRLMAEVAVLKEELKKLRAAKRRTTKA